MRQKIKEQHTIPLTYPNSSGKWQCEENTSKKYDIPQGRMVIANQNSNDYEPTFLELMV